MGDDEWQVVSKKTKPKQATGGAASTSAVVAGVKPAPDQLASIRAQVAALRAGKAPPAGTFRAPVRASISTRPSGTTQTTPVAPPSEVLRRLSPLVDAETIKSKLNGDKYYQAFVRATMDSKGNLAVRFHKTDVVVVKANGDVQLTTGKWFTTTTMHSMNDVLGSINMQVRFEGNPKDSNWKVHHPGGVSSFYDDMVIEARTENDRSRAQRVQQRARELGIACFVYVKNDQAAFGAGTSAASAAGSLPPHLRAPQPPIGGSGAGFQVSSAGFQPAAPPATASTSSGGWAVQGVAEAAQGSLADRMKARSYQEIYAQMQGLSVAQEPAEAQASTTGGYGHAPAPEPPPPASPAPKLTAQHFDSFLMDDVLDEDTACVACMAKARDTVIVPCGHLVLCADCSIGINTCPMCRMPVSELISLA